MFVLSLVSTPLTYKSNSTQSLEFFVEKRVDFLMNINDGGKCPLSLIKQSPAEIPMLEVNDHFTH